MDKKNTKTSSKLPNQTPLFGVVDIQWLVSHIKEVQILRQEHQANLAALQQWVKAANAEIAAQSVSEDKNSLAQKYQQELSQKQQAMQQNPMLQNKKNWIMFLPKEHWYSADKILRKK